ncbi:hypothetical protein [Aestuariispira ectoiniformans]|uniref:hypothetical protein n=1 Tax=Aestuariispira ectoiniformans TaxID=2775080 RepID=UPI00223B3B6D|nr:hypothetical protein [Aestuariispira ectoiniformans]
MQDNVTMTDRASAARPSFRRNAASVFIAFVLGTVASGCLLYLTVQGMMAGLIPEEMIDDFLKDSPYLALVAAVLYLPYPLVSVGSGVIAAEVIVPRWGSKGSVLIVAVGILAGFAFSKVDFLFYKDSMIGIVASAVSILAYWLFAWLPSIQSGKMA